MCINCVKMIEMSVSFRKALGLPIDVNCYMSIENAWWVISETRLVSLLKAFDLIYDPNQDIYDYRRYFFDHFDLLGKEIGIPPPDEVEIADIPTIKIDQCYTVYLQTAPRLQ